MRVEVVPQVELGTVQRLRVGDVLSRIIASDEARASGLLLLLRVFQA